MLLGPNLGAGGQGEKRAITIIIEPHQICPPTQAYLIAIAAPAPGCSRMTEKLCDDAGCWLLSIGEWKPSHLNHPALLLCQTSVSGRLEKRCNHPTKIGMGIIANGRGTSQSTPPSSKTTCHEVARARSLTAGGTTSLCAGATNMRAAVIRWPQHEWPVFCLVYQKSCLLAAAGCKPTESHSAVLRTEPSPASSSLFATWPRTA